MCQVQLMDAVASVCPDRRPISQTLKSVTTEAVGHQAQHSIKQHFYTAEKNRQARYQGYLTVVKDSSRYRRLEVQCSNQATTKQHRRIGCIEKPWRQADSKERHRDHQEACVPGCPRSVSLPAGKRAARHALKSWKATAQGRSQEQLQQHL